MNKSFLQVIGFGTMAVNILLMMAATILEKLYGSYTAFSWVYHNPVFFVLWAITAVCGLYSLSSMKGLFTKCIHVAFTLILGGAFLTHVTGEEGNVRLPKGETVTTWTREDGSEEALPCPLVLERFEIERYSGSEAAADYKSFVEADGRKLEISMNHIARISGYRFFQSRFEKNASILSINHDPWGIGVTYTGYALLLLSLIGYFFQRGTTFRKHLNKLLALVFLLLLPSVKGLAQNQPKVLPKDVADAFEELYVYYNDRVVPFETMARDYTLKAYGKTHWKDYTATQVVTGWLFYYDWWKDVPFKVKAKDRGTPREAEKSYIVQQVASGDAWKLYPIADSTGHVKWYNSNEMLPQEVVEDYDRWVFIRKVMDLVERSVRAEDWAEVTHIVEKIGAYQKKEAAEILPSPVKVRAEKLYNRLMRPMVPFMFSITLGLILFVLLGIRLSRGKELPYGVSKASALIALVLLLYLTLTLGLRWYVSGHAPFAGSYSVMMLMAWLSALGICLLWKRFPMVLPMGFLIGGFTMLMASMSGANPQITHLMPVLQSPLLSLHVLAMMLSYTLFGMVAFTGILGLVVPVRAAIRLRDMSLVILFPAVFLLITGTFLGAVWANISWGTYWSWDPKETWALITFLVYSYALHADHIRFLRHPRTFHAFCALAFLMVLVTYFGVNLVLGGMHAYA
ncbi:MAG TPA: cytochrome C biogenesis protein [Rikenellaceae bacterium]|nr:cytochrome C biogenesis protein [Rikenellaceae bacterium]